MSKKPHQRSLGPKVPMLAVLLSLTTTILLVLLPVIVNGPDMRSAFALIAAYVATVLASLLALTASIVTLLRILAYRGRFREIDRTMAEGGGRLADIGALISVSHGTGLVAEIKSIGDFLLALNDDVVLLQRSATKFDLFASDILFSARNLSRLAGSDLAMLMGLREKSEGYYGRLLATSRELEELTGGMAGYVSDAEALKDRALASRDLLGEVSRATSEAAGAAGGGSSSLAATKVSADALIKGIRELDLVTEKESLEAKRIVQALRVIEDIVEQTHILATNASIEAAHAGARGAGFGVIALEIRKLAASSRASLSDITEVLDSIATGIASSARLSTASRERALVLGGAVEDSQSRFAAIVERVRGVDRILGEFARVFSDQIEASSKLAGAAEAASGRIRSFGLVFSDGAADYRAIAESAGKAEEGAKDAHRASRVLAQLSAYLKIGGMERNRVLRRYRVLESAESLRYPRKEGRQLLLYNLEVLHEDGRPLGYLGDLSPSGMLLLADEEVAVGTTPTLRIVLPITSEGERFVTVRVEVRRIERDSDGFRAGCSFVETDNAARRSIEDLLATLALDAISTPLAGFEGSPRQDGQGGRSSAPGKPPAQGGASSDEALDVEDLEELP